MSNQSVQPIQINSATSNHTGILYHTTYNQVHSGFATVNNIQKKEKASISSIFSNWKKDKNQTGEPPTLCTSYQSTAYPFHQYASATTSPTNYIIDSKRKLMHYNAQFYKTHGGSYLQSSQQSFPSTIHATIRYLPNHKQRSNSILTASHWEPFREPNTITYQNPTTYHTSNGQPITLQHEITYSEQITIAPSNHLSHQCFNKSTACCPSKNCNCLNHYHQQFLNDKASNYFLIPTATPNSSLLDSSTKLHNKSTDCMISNNKKGQQIKHSSIRGSKSHHNLNLDQTTEQLNTVTNLNKKKGTKLASTVNERFLKIFKKSIKEPFSGSKKSRKSILDCDLTAYDLVEEDDDSKENDDVNDKLNIQKLTPSTLATNLIDSSLDDEDEDRFENNFIQAKFKQKQHYYSPASTFKQQTNESVDSMDGQQDKVNKTKTNKQTDSTAHQNLVDRKNQNVMTTKSTNKTEVERWNLSSFKPSNTSAFTQKCTSKFNSCRIAGQGIKFNRRMSILKSDLSKQFPREEELSEDEDKNRFDRYAQNFKQLDKIEKMNSTMISKSTNLNSIPNLPDPDYDEDDDRHTLSRSTSDLDQTIGNEQRSTKKSTIFKNTTSLYNLNNSSSFKNSSLIHPPLPPLPKIRSQQLLTKTNCAQKIQSSSPSSSTYSSFNSSINSNVKSILKKSNPNLVLFENPSQLQSKPTTKSSQTELFDSSSVMLKRKDSKLSFFNDAIIEEDKMNKRCLMNKSVSTFKSLNINKKLEDYKPKKVHFRSSFNDELIVEHIDNQELNEDEQIYDDILTTRLKQPQLNDSSEEETNEKSIDQSNKETSFRKFEENSNQSNQNSSPSLFDKFTNNEQISECSGEF